MGSNLRTQRFLTFQNLRVTYLSTALWSTNFFPYSCGIDYTKIFLNLPNIFFGISLEENFHNRVKIVHLWYPSWTVKSESKHAYNFLSIHIKYFLRASASGARWISECDSERHMYLQIYRKCSYSKLCTYKYTVLNTYQ